MTITRRQFLAGSAAAAAVVSLPTIAAHALPGRVIIFDRELRQIIIRRGYVTALELHRFVQDQLDQSRGAPGELDICDENPTLRITDQIIRMDHGWTIEEASMRWLYGGTIEQGNELWSCFAGYGDLSDADEAIWRSDRLIDGRDWNRR